MLLHAHYWVTDLGKQKGIIVVLKWQKYSSTVSVGMAEADSMEQWETLQGKRASMNLLCI